MKPSKFRLLIFLFIIPAFFLSACGGGGGGGGGAGGGGSPPDLAASLPFFEDFFSRTIDGAKWNTLNFGGNLDCTPILNVFEFVPSQSYTVSAVAATGAGDCGVEFVNSANVASFSSQITVTRFSEDPAEGPIRARLRGIFYNDGPIPNPGAPSFKSDIFAQIYSKGTVVEASVRRCLEDNCMSELLFGETQLGTITLGDTHTLFLGWDGDTTFTFQLDTQTPVIFDAMDAAIPALNIGPAVGGVIPGSKVVELRGGSPDATGSIAATFDNIRCATVGGGTC